MTSTELVLQEERKPGGLMRPVAEPAELIQAGEETRALITQALQEGRDYGPIPGVAAKPVLFKPGAERLCSAFGVYPRFTIVSVEVDHDREVSWTKRQKTWKNRKFAGWQETAGVSQGLYRYVVECELISRATGEIVGQALASCSSMESRYIDRPRDVEGTCLSIASKRAHVAAVRIAFGLSGAFAGETEESEEVPSSGPERSLTERWQAVLQRFAITPQELEVLALADPDRPDALEDWTDEDYEACGARIERHGRVLLERARERLDE